MDVSHWLPSWLLGLLIMAFMSKALIQLRSRSERLTVYYYNCHSVTRIPGIYGKSHEINLSHTLTVKTGRHKSISTVYLSNMSTASLHTFSIIDYLVFGSFLIASALIGIIFGIKGSNSNKSFLTGNRDLSTFPVVMSLAASFMSTNTILGVPAEVYTLGTQFVVHVIPFSLAVILSAEVFMPVFYDLNMTSVNEYLLLRFRSTKLRTIGSIGFIACTLPYMGVVLYGPSLALASVTTLSVEASVIVVGVICTFYTSIGGIKAVIWTDVLQCILMILGLLMVVIYGIASSPVNPFQVASDHGRIKLFDFSLNPYRNDIFFAVFFGTIVNWCGCYCISQTEVQRFCSTKSAKHAKKTLYWNIPPVVCISLMAITCGIVIFARYYECDPVSMGIIKRTDQLMPYFVMESMSWMPGVAGFFTACVFSGSLSTLSSGFNSLAAVTWDDLLIRLPCIQVQDKNSFLSRHLTKFIAASYGILSLGLAFFVGRLGTVLQASIALSGSTRGPLFGLFCLGMFFPFVNEVGGISGIVSGLSVSLFMAVGSIFHPRPKARLDIGTHNCSQAVYDAYGLRDESTHILPWQYEPQGIDKFIHLSYFFVSVIGFLTTMIVGLSVSLMTRSTEDPVVEDRLLSRFHLPDIPRGVLNLPWKCKYKVSQDEVSRSS